MPQKSLGWSKAIIFYKWSLCFHFGIPTLFSIQQLECSFTNWSCPTSVTLLFKILQWVPSQNRAQIPSMVYKALQDLASAPLSAWIINCSPTEILSMLKQAKYTSASGALYELFPLPGMLFPQTFTWLISSRHSRLI